MKSRITGSTILVTGGAGLVGSTVVDHLLQHNPHEIRVFDLSEESAPQNLASAMTTGKVRFVAGDIRNADHVDNACEGADFVFHQAAIRVTKCQEAPALAHEVMINGTFHVLSACVKHKVKKVVAASSAIAYGPPEVLPVPESHPLLDRTMYGVAKIANEHLLEAFFRKNELHYVALRYFNIYGPRMNLFGPHTEVLIKWLDQIDDGKPPLIYGDGRQSMDFIFIDDVARANILALLSSASNDVVNVGTGIETNLNQLAKLLLETLNSKFRPEYREARSVNQIPRRFANTKKAKRLLDFEARVELKSGLSQLIEWRRSMKSRSEHSPLQQSLTG